MKPPHHPAIGMPVPDPLRPIAQLQRIRRACALGLGIIGVFDLVTSVLPPSFHHLTSLLSVAPLVVVQAAAALLALCGLLLLALARGLRRGQRQAWAMSCIVLVMAAFLHLARGIDGLQSVLSVVLLLILVVLRDAFLASTDRAARRPVAVLLVGGPLATIVLSVTAVESFLALDRDGQSLPIHDALVGVAERMIGVQTVAFPERVNRFLSPTLLGVGLCLAVFAVLVISRPLVDRRHRNNESSYAQARRLVDAHGGGTLDYFALRYDKRHHFIGETLITYAVHGGVCLVSPDPIGPLDERPEAWAQFCRFADARGWIVAVLGADAASLPVYRRTGMRSLYIGDEAIVTLADFDLGGGHKKGLRQAVNRIARYGYEVSFHDPRHLEPALAEGLRSLMVESRRGERERGFSMTLGRMFDPNDDGLLLAVARGPDGSPAAFCQFVPAPTIDGYSLDLMRRDHGEHPNGLIDFLIVKTIEHLRELGMVSLGLNFATMRAVLAGEGRNATGVLRWLCKRLSSSMQIESLWRFTAKYDPEWVGRYLVFGTIEHVLSVALAVARAESMWELPLIGRYLDSERRGRLSPAPDPEEQAA
ncbi:MAG: bifunctional lysylphosphatidylglycerol flippase/synthetase MprF [Acidimicrobiales bacterium]